METSNPTVSEIREWAYSKIEWPDQEWPLYLSWTGETKLFIELATDHKCPNKDFFLYMLFFLVGNAYKPPSKTETNERIKAIISNGNGLKHGDIRRWVKLSNDLIQCKIIYTYNDWCGGELANYR